MKLALHTTQKDAQIAAMSVVFYWSEIGAEQLGILQSLMVTCRLQGVNPYHYLVDVLQRVSMHPAKDIIDLIPRVWKGTFSQTSLINENCRYAPQH